MRENLQNIKEKWDWLYRDGKLDEEAVLKEISDYDFILGEIPYESNADRVAAMNIAQRATGLLVKPIIYGQ